MAQAKADAAAAPGDQDGLAVQASGPWDQLQQAVETGFFAGASAKHRTRRGNRLPDPKECDIQFV
jgi:hypothetical protein